MATNFVPIATLGNGVGLYVDTDTNDLYMDHGGTNKLKLTSGGATVTGTLTTSGAATLSSTLGVTGAATLSSTLAVTGASTLTGNLVKAIGSGAALNIKTATEELTGLSGATAVTTSLVAAGCLVLGVATRVTTEITGATSFTIGDGTDVDAFGTGIALTAGTTTNLDDYTAGYANPAFYPSGFDVTLTATGSNFTAGAVRVAVCYLDMTAPTA